MSDAPEQDNALSEIVGDEEDESVGVLLAETSLPPSPDAGLNTGLNMDAIPPNLSDNDDSDEDEDEDEDIIASVITSVLAALPEIIEDQKKRRGPKAPNVGRMRDEKIIEVLRNYFGYDGKPPIFSEKDFHRRFRIPKSYYQMIESAILASPRHGEYFKKKKDATGKDGLDPKLKILGALKMLAGNLSADSLEDTYTMSKRVALESLKRFCKAMTDLFGAVYLRRPTQDDVRKLYEENAERGFPGCIGSLDCMHVKWRNCPNAHKGQFKGAKSVPTIVLEAVASKSLWIWHCMFGVPGVNNDLTVLGYSDILEVVSAIEEPYILNGKERRKPYYLVDGIYPDFEVFAKPFNQPSTVSHKLYNDYQESVRKDVERAFGILQAKFWIIRDFVRLYGLDDIGIIVKCCVILHNMAVEHRLSGGEIIDVEEFLREDHGDVLGNIVGNDFDRLPHELLQAAVDRLYSSEQGFVDLRNDLVRHLWAREGTL